MANPSNKIALITGGSRGLGTDMAFSLARMGIDVIVTDHHAVPEIIPEEVIAILNPKRKDSQYPFPSLAGAGVAFKLLHGIIEQMKNVGISHREE